MKKTKAFVLRVIGIFLSLLILTASLVYVIDPFYLYHKPWFGFEPFLDEAVYQTAGAAKNFDYDSVILGSSMVENFNVAKFDELFGWETIKLAYSAALMDDYSSILSQVFSTHQVKNLIFPIDNYTMIAKVTDYYVPRPEYLYDENLLNDVSYLLNYDVIQRSIQVITNKMNNTEPKYETSYFWNRTDFSTATVMHSYLYERTTTAWNDEESDFLVENALENVAVLGSYIEQYPDTTFYVFFPPYNVMFWDYKILMGHKDATLEMNQRIIEYFLQFDNVEIYYFMDKEDLVTDLDYYVDRGHYSPEINDYIMESIANKKHLVTKENYQQIPQKMNEILEAYDFETVIQQWSNP